MTNRKLINQLIQLQELVVARMQKKAAMPTAPLDALDQNIALLGADLPAPIKSHLNRLLQKKTGSRGADHQRKLLRLRHPAHP